jgi:hypothetical protein
VRGNGNLWDLADKFEQLPRKQLVMLGAPGAGKTVLAVFLALGLRCGQLGDHGGRLGQGAGTCDAPALT